MRDPAADRGHGKLYLPDVTLVLMDGDCPELALLALQRSLAGIRFGGVMVKFHPWKSIAEYSRYFWYELPDLIDTPYILYIQWDAWIVHPELWTDEFLQYDYVGAPWNNPDGFNVGNGTGVRSLKLMKFLKHNIEGFPLIDGVAEDHLICRKYRERLEAHGFRWPTEQLASRLSIETTRPHPTSRHFMFHDAFNFPMVLPPDELEQQIALMKQNPRLKDKLYEIALKRGHHLRVMRA